MPELAESLALALTAIVWIGLPIAFIVFVVYAIIRYAGWRVRRNDVVPRDPLTTLADRYARGEIDDDEFARRRAVLSEASRHS